MIKGLVLVYCMFIGLFMQLKAPIFAQTVTATFSSSKLPIKLGSSTALEGLAHNLGLKTSLGEKIYLEKTNAEGGINHQKLQLIVYNDGYDPVVAALNMRKLITQDKVLAIMGNVGTPMAVVSVPIIKELKILFYAAYSGAAILRKKPPDRYVFNFKASHKDEVSSIIHGLLLAGIQPDEMAFFTQNDSLGESGYSNAIQALEKMGHRNTGKLLHARFTRNTLNVEEGLSEFLDLPKAPKAIIIMAPYLPAAKFIKLATQYFPKAFFLTVAFVDSDSLAEELKGVGNEHVIVTQVVPDYRGNLPAVIEYRKTLATYAPGTKPGFISLEGYLATKLLVVGLKRAAERNQLTREGIIDALETLHDVDIGIGLPISFDKNNHNALHTVWPTLLKNGRFVPFNWSELRSIEGNSSGRP